LVSQINGSDANLAPSDPINWPPKNPFTIRFAVALADTSADSSTTAREIERGYQFWEYTLNNRGGIPIDEKNNALVEVKFLYYNQTSNSTANSEQHKELLTKAVEQGNADFLLGGETSFASDELLVSEKQRRITMLCCHGPPVVYRQAAEAASGYGENMLFGIHVNSELYTSTLIRSIVVNKKAEKIALVVTNRNTSTFTSTAVDSTMKQLHFLNNFGIYSNFPYAEVIEIPQEFTLDLAYHKKVARRIKEGKFETVLAFTLNDDGKVFLKALQEEKPLLKTLFVTVTPTNKESVENLTDSASGVRMEHVLSAGQWHVQLNFGEDPGSYSNVLDENKRDQVLWPTSTDFAESFENFTSTYRNSTEPTTYTQASAAAAAYALQLSITEAFKGCQGVNYWNGSSSSLLFDNKWSCGSKNAYSLGSTQQTGYQLVLRALRALNRDTFFGKILFSTDQRNVGRDAVTFQLLNQNKDHTDKFLGSVNFGCDFRNATGVNATTWTSKVGALPAPEDCSGSVQLIQEVVLPSEYETRSLMLPRPPRWDDFDWCPGGFELDNNDDCQPCPRGAYRASFTGEAGDLSKFRCSKCNFTSYQEKEGSTDCSPCPNFSQTGIPGATDISDCTCQRGFYNETFSPGVNCTYCPEGATCPGGILPLILEEGFWSENITTGNSAAANGTRASRAAYKTVDGEFDVFPCSPKSACPSGTTLSNETCAAGWGGNICSLCGYDNGKEGAEDYFLVFGTCRKCTSKAVNLLIFFGILVAWLFINLLMAEELQSFALLVDWFQLMSLVGAINVNWPSSLAKFYSIAQFFAFEVDVISLRCVNPSWYYLSDMILQFSLPIAVILVYIALGLCVKIYRGEKLCGQTNKTKNELKSRLAINSSKLQAPKGCIPRVAKPFKRGLRRAASATVRKLESKNVRFTFDDIWRRALNILEITYLASVQYGFSSLRGIKVGNEIVVAKAPYTVQTSTIVILGAMVCCLASPVHAFVF
jgi:Tyrosine-protein kinase ephrin type A/B receptor-like